LVGVKSLWLVIRIRAYGEGLGPLLGLGVQSLELEFSMVHLMQTKSCSLLDSPETMTTLICAWD